MILVAVLSVPAWNLAALISLPIRFRNLFGFQADPASFLIEHGTKPIRVEQRRIQINSMYCYWYVYYLYTKHII